MPFMTEKISIYYEIHGHGQPLLFIHGLGSSLHDWKNQVEFFSKTFQVIVFDLRGHGKSDKPRGPYTIPLFAADTAGLLSHLSPAEPVHVVGHSLGGMVAFQLVLDAPHLVKSLTVLNSFPAAVFPTLKMRLGFSARIWSVRLFGMRKLAEKLAHSLFPELSQHQLRETFIRRWNENDPDAYISSLKAFRGWNVMPELSSIGCNTLIVSADQDYTSIALKESYVRLIKHARLVAINNSRHMTLLDQPAAFNQALQIFLESYCF